MLEKEFTLEQRLSLAYHGRKDFTEALSRVDGIADTAPFKRSPLIYVGKSLARAGLDTTGVMGRLRYLAELPQQQHRNGIYEGMAEIDLARGVFSWFEILTDASPHALSREFCRNLVAQEAKHGLDPSSLLAQLRSGIKEGTSGNPSPYTEIAVIHYEATGEYPKEFLSKAEAGIEDYKREYSDPVHIPGYYMEMAKGYASCHDFNRALMMVDRIRGHNPIVEAQMRMQALKHIATEQIATSFFAEGGRTAERAVATILQAQAEPEHLRGNLEFDQRFDVPKLMLLSAKAKALAGGDPSVLFESISEKVRNLPDGGYYKADILIEKARVENSIGLDSEQTLNQALQELDGMDKEARCNEIDWSRQVTGYEDLGETAAVLGYINLARETVTRLDNVDGRSDTTTETITILANMGEYQAKTGISAKEIRTLVDPFGRLWVGDKVIVDPLRPFLAFGLDKD